MDVSSGIDETVLLNSCAALLESFLTRRDDADGFALLHYISSHRNEHAEVTSKYKQWETWRLHWSRVRHTMRRSRDHVSLQLILRTACYTHLTKKILSNNRNPYPYILEKVKVTEPCKNLYLSGSSLYSRLYMADCVGQFDNNSTRKEVDVLRAALRGLMRNHILLCISER